MDEPNPRLKLLWIAIRRGILLIIAAIDGYFKIDQKQITVIVQEK